MKLLDTQLPQMFSRSLYEEQCIDIAPEHMDKIAGSLFTGAANLLNASKTKDHPVALVFKKVEGAFVAASVVQYFPGKDKNDPGNWSLVWTFDENDIPADALQIDVNDVRTHSYFIAAAGTIYGIEFQNTMCLVNLLIYVLSQIKKWLDENAKESEEVVVEQDGYFEARVAIENGEKVFALSPAGEIKVLIKDDASIEK